MMTYVDEEMRTVLLFTHGSAKFHSYHGQVSRCAISVWNRKFCNRSRQKSCSRAQKDVICGVQGDI